MGATPVHGFANDSGSIRPIRCDEAPESDPSGDEIDPTAENLLYWKLRDRNWNAGPFRATPTSDDAVIYCFRAREPGRPTSKVEFLVPDSPGAHYVSRESNPGEDHDYDKRRGKEVRWLKDCDAIILVLPAPYRPKQGEINTRYDDEVERNIKQLGEIARESPRLERVIVAISKFERMFFSYGRDAFHNACNSDVARAAMSEAIKRYEMLWEIGNEWPGAKERMLFVPVSSFGFVKEFGNPNVSPWSKVQAGTLVPDHSSDEHEYWRSEDNKDVRFGWEEGCTETDPQRAYWRPFCVLDPFLLAVFPHIPATDCRYAFTWNDVFAQERVQRERMKIVIVSAVPWYRRLYGFLVSLIRALLRAWNWLAAQLGLPRLA